MLFLFIGGGLLELRRRRWRLLQALLVLLTGLETKDVVSMLTGLYTHFATYSRSPGRKRFLAILIVAHEDTFRCQI